MEESPSCDWVNETLEELMSHDRDYWHSRTPQERLAALELMRQAYGYDPLLPDLKEFLKLLNSRSIEKARNKCLRRVASA